MKTFLLIVSLIHLCAFTLWTIAPVNHAYVPSGNFYVDAVLIPIGSSSLLLLLIGGVAQFWIP